MPSADEGFFDSGMVKESLKEIQEMQMNVLLFTSYAEYAPLSEHRRHIDLMKKLLEKQKNMYYRMSLSKDPEAKSMMEDVEGHFRENGYDVQPGNAFHIFDEVMEDVEEGFKTIQRELGDGDENGPGKYLF